MRQELEAAVVPHARAAMWRPSCLRGPPGIVGASPLAIDPEVAERLWTLSEQLTGVRTTSDILLPAMPFREA